MDTPPGDHRQRRWDTAVARHELTGAATCAKSRLSKGRHRTSDAMCTRILLLNLIADALGACSSLPDKVQRPARESADVVVGVQGRVAQGVDTGIVRGTGGVCWPATP